MCANVVAGLSGVAAAYFVNRFGAMNTMLFSHFPSNVAVLVNETLDSPKRFQIVRRFPSSARDFKPNQDFEALFKIPYIYVQSQQKRQADFPSHHKDAAT